MNLETLVREMSGYDDFWDYNVGRMPLLGAGRQARVFEMPDEPDFVLRVSHGDGWFEYARMIIEDTTGLGAEEKIHLPEVRELAYHEGLFFGITERLRPVMWDTPMDLWRHTAIRSRIEHTMDAAELRDYLSDLKRFQNEMPYFLGFMQTIQARHSMICDSNFTNWMERERDASLVWSDPIVSMTDDEKFAFIDRYETGDALGKTFR